MRELIPTIRAWQAAATSASDDPILGRAVVVRSFGSAPRPEGATLVASGDGRLAGSVSGGCVEGAAFEEIGCARRDGVSRVIRYGISDEQAWDVGLACGGTIDVLVEPFLRPEVVAAASALPGSPGSAVVIPLPPDSPPPAFGPAPRGAGAAPAPAFLADEAGTLSGTTGDAALDAAVRAAAREVLARGGARTVEAGGRQAFVEGYAAAPRLVIVGAVEAARTLVRFARELGYATVVVDGRSAFATRERFPDADQVVVGWPDEVADAIGLGQNDAVAILTHDVKFDEPAIVEALRRGCRYVGAVGSRRTQTDRRERLLAAGVPEEQMARLRGPIGLDLGGRAPAETALSIIAEVVADRFDGTGVPLWTKAARREMLAP